MSKCDNDCKYYKYLSLGQVVCQYYNKFFDSPETCAAKVLTKIGWENAAKEASKNGDIERAYLYNERAKKTN